MKFIPLDAPPATVPGKDGSPVPVFVNGKPFTTTVFIRWLIEYDTRFQSDAKGLRFGTRIDTHLDVAEAGGLRYVAVADDVHAMLAEAAESPQNAHGSSSYPFSPAKSLLPMIDDIVGATDSMPEPRAQVAAPAPA